MLIARAAHRNGGDISGCRRLDTKASSLAAERAIHDVLVAVPQMHGVTDGEKRNMRMLTKLVRAIACTEEIREFVVFTTRMGLFNLLTEFGLAVGDDTSLAALAEAATADGATSHKMPVQVAADRLAVALKSIDGLSRLVYDREGLRAPEPMTVH